MICGACNKRTYKADAMKTKDENKKLHALLGKVRIVDYLTQNDRMHLVSTSAETLTH